MDKQNYKFEPRKYRFPTRFRPQYPRSSLCSVVVLTHDFRRLEAHSVRLGRRLNKLEDNRHVNFSNILQWYSSTPMAMTILAPSNNRRTRNTIDDARAVVLLPLEAAVRRSRGPSQTLAMEGLSEPPVLPLFRCRT